VPTFTLKRWPASSSGATTRSRSGVLRSLFCFSRSRSVVLRS
jgi:hypothetical protein